MNGQARHLHLQGATGTIQTTEWDGREHWIVPVVALMEGVIHAVNADEPELVTAEVLQKAVHRWNGRPVVLGHPKKNGKQVSALSAEIKDQYAFGMIRGAHMNGTRLGMEVLVDPERLREMKQTKLLADLEAGKPIEVSVGAYVVTKDATGQHGNKSYKGEWLEIYGDHLAFLPDGVGACSLEMGCGAHRAAMLVTAESFEVLGGPGSGNFGHGGRPGQQGGSSSDGSGGSDDKKAGSPAAHSHAKSVHESAAYDHRTAAKVLRQADVQTYVNATNDKTKSTHELVAKDAAKSSKLASAATKASGATAYAAQAARSYAQMAAKAKTPEEKARYHEEAAKLHEQAAKWHDTVAKLRGAEQAPEELEITGLQGLLDARVEQLRVAIGARNNKHDMKLLQAIHDHVCTLGAKCAEPKAAEKAPLARIRLEGGWWNVYSEDRHRVLGRYPSKTEAEEFQNAIDEYVARRSA